MRQTTIFLMILIALYICEVETAFAGKRSSLDHLTDHQLKSLVKNYFHSDHDNKLFNSKRAKISKDQQTEIEDDCYVECLFSSDDQCESECIKSLTK